jgi:hypothetical protein
LFLVLNSIINSIDEGKGKYMMNSVTSITDVNSEYSLVLLNLLRHVLLGNRYVLKEFEYSNLIDVKDVTEVSIVSLSLIVESRSDEKKSLVLIKDLDVKGISNIIWDVFN